VQVSFVRSLRARYLNVWCLGLSGITLERRGQRRAFDYIYNSKGRRLSRADGWDGRRGALQIVGSLIFVAAHLLRHSSQVVWNYCTGFPEILCLFRASLF
jgi:hypothetical protein